MEKYRSTADPSTGLHPFLPPPRVPIRQMLLRGPIVYLLRLPAATVFLLLHFVFRVGGQFFRWLGSHPPGRLLEVIGDLILRFSLQAAGISSRAPAGRLPMEPRHGDIIFANLASYLDVIYLSAYLTPTFLVPRGEGLVLITPVRAFLWSLGGPAIGPRFSIDNAGTYARRYRRGPVIVLAEGCATNGRGVLRFARQVRPPRGHSYALGMRHSREKRECFTVGSPTAHFLALLVARPAVGARLFYIRDSEAVDLQAEVARLAGIPPLSIGSAERQRFMTHWAETAGGEGTAAYAREK